MKKMMIGTSWKMNKTISEALSYCSTLTASLPHATCSRIQPFFLPPFTAIHPISEFFKQRSLPWLTGAQNMHFQASGAWTGEISAAMIAEAGGALVELGHSERRTAFNETDEAVNAKVHAALRSGLRPLVCIGDNVQEQSFGVSHETVVRQMKIALHGVDARQISQVVVAYEPVWAIGEGGTPATPQWASQMHQVLRSALCGLYGEENGHTVPLLYGGSVDLQNCTRLISQTDIDGLFIGRAAWSAEGYCAIVRRVVQDFILKER